MSILILSGLSYDKIAAIMSRGTVDPVQLYDLSACSRAVAMAKLITTIWQDWQPTALMQHTLQLFCDGNAMLATKVLEHMQVHGLIISEGGKMRFTLPEPVNQGIVAAIERRKHTGV